MPSRPAGPATRALFGGAILLTGQSAALAGWTALSTWTTPFCWWGYLLLLDALIERRTGRSPFFGRPLRFAAWTMLSVLLWLIFEAYNLRLRNWEYVGLPEDPRVRALGYFASFATIMPGLFLTAMALEAIGGPGRRRCRPVAVGVRGRRLMAAAGAACLAVPPLLPPEIGRYLFAPVWVGFVLLLEPLNDRLGGPSLLRDLADGHPGTALRLLGSGYVCGLLWELWNFRAAAKWIYHVPFLPEVRIFEMPILGFLGFGPFALEFYALYATAAVAWARLRGAAGAPLPNPTIP